MELLFIFIFVVHDFVVTSHKHISILEDVISFFVIRRSGEKLNFLLYYCAEIV